MSNRNRFAPDTAEAQKAALVAHVRAELARVGMTATELAGALGVAGDRIVPGRLVQRTEREGLQP